jgi:hypothetical protein
MPVLRGRATDGGIEDWWLNRIVRGEGWKKIRPTGKKPAPSQSTEAKGYVARSRPTLLSTRWSVAEHPGSLLEAGTHRTSRQRRTLADDAPRCGMDLAIVRKRERPLPACNGFKRNLLS